MHIHMHIHKARQADLMPLVVTSLEDGGHAKEPILRLLLEPCFWIVAGEQRKPARREAPDQVWRHDG